MPLDAKVLSARLESIAISNVTLSAEERIRIWESAWLVRNQLDIIEDLLKRGNTYSGVTS